MEGLKVRLLEKTIFRRIFRPKKEEIPNWRVEKIAETVVCNFSPNVVLFE
jgi:hypothetical protein